MKKRSMKNVIFNHSKKKKKNEYNARNNKILFDIIF